MFHSVSAFIKLLSNYFYFRVLSCTVFTDNGASMKRKLKTNEQYVILKKVLFTSIDHTSRKSSK